MVTKKATKSLIRKPKTDKALETKELILTATTQILLKEGIEAINTNYIAKKAGVSIGTLYQYFKDKDDILAMLLERTIDTRVEIAKNAISFSMVLNSIEEIVTKVVDALLSKSSEENAKLEFVLFSYAMNNKRLLVVQKIKSTHDFFMPLLKILLTAKVPSLKKRNLEAVSFLLMQSTRSIITGRVLSPDMKISDEDIKQELIKLVLAYLKA
jgi:AcrR family transcriptional regulator